MTTQEALASYLGRPPTAEETAMFEDQRTRIEFGVIYNPLWSAQETATGLAARDPSGACAE
ncbi:hypothetical protein Q4511_01135 [Paracoccus sp. 1_MG-2023]|uniref:hypothetical protein n=1 Tax=unclassified Paracoccus (in: a-proteobacteria) TaxID=2688777 RepID=UPI001C07F02F|nr:MULTISPECIES: hypothetical protein [unclassified Paracoccus (in: a-proteobacteria)]MBU2957637.1 hypothetical protein [Paracoccus sp. C2R09]MDO6667516.1 hypothetical protein [Paracoccus sp. 1_MG-2023]